MSSVVEQPAANQEVAGSSLYWAKPFLIFFVKSLTKSLGNLNTFKIVGDRFLRELYKV